MPFSFTSSNQGPDGPATGLTECVDCVFADGAGPAITIRGKPAAGYPIRFVNCRFVNPAKGKPEVPAILYQTRAGNTEDVGGVEFRDCLLEDATNRPIMQYGDWARGLRLLDVTGTIRIRRGGAETLHTFTPRFLDELCPENVLKRFPRYEVANVRFEPVGPDSAFESYTLRPFTLRRAGTLAIHARGGDEVALTLGNLRVGR